MAQLWEVAVMYDFTCPHCGSPFVSPKATRRFCSRPCADVGRRVHLHAALAALPTDDCVEWTGHIQKLGYGRGVSAGSRRTLLAHRAVWQRVHGAIPDGMQLDHLCRNRRCVNPAHLEVVTHKQNMERAIMPNSRLTHCKRGHEFTPENTYRHGPRRHCKQCRSDYQIATRAARRHLRVVVER